jgi:thymidylate kinase
MGSARPLRVSVVGIDGAGKSSTTLRAIDALASTLTVAKPGRQPFVVGRGRRTECAPRVSRFFETLFRRADETRRRAAIGLSRLLFIRWQGSLEPYMERAFRPDVVLGTRCMILDPAIYSGVYAGRLARASLEAKLGAFRRLSRLPFRDLYVLLRTPADAAMRRIHGRIAKERGFDPGPRERWLHLHEDEAILRDLGRRFDEALTAAARLARIAVIEIDTTRTDEAGVASRIADGVRARFLDRGLRRCG